MALRYVRQYSAKVPEVFKYSSDTDHEKTHASLSTKCKEMKLRSQLSYEFVSKYLTKYNQCAISTKVDNNSLICSVIVQLKTPKGLTSQIVRHQLAQYMVSEVVFFFPIVKEYLGKHRISYNSYVKGIYHGTIWADKYIIGALFRMVNIKITVISPYYSDVWNVFHRSTIPDMQMTSKYANNMWRLSRCNMQRKPSTQIISQIIYMILKWNNSTFLRKFYSITHSCHTGKIVYNYGDYEECSRWCVDDL